VGQPLLNYLKRCIEASAQADDAIHELDNLLETGFYGKEVKLVEKMLQTLDTIENDTDEMQIKIRHQLYTLEKNLPPIDALFMYKIIEWMGDLADRAQAVGGQLLLMLAN
jgi:predicted phosphate transport protein (TIGR00153 family)